MDEISCMMNIDPLEFRRRNLLKKGDRTSTNQVLRESFGLEQTLTQALERSGWFEKRRKYENEKNGTKRKGIGISTIFYGVGLGAAGKHMSRTGAYVQLESDGSATFSVGTTEMGQGMETVLSQIVAQELGIPYSKVTMNPVDTTRVPDSGPTVASRATTFSGNALMDACAKIRNNLLNAASRQLGISQQRLNITGDKIVDIENPDLESMTVLETISLCTKARMDLAAHGFHREKHQVWDPETGIGDAYIIYSYATKIAEVEVDLDTGEVALLEITSAHDVGRAINPQQVEAQIQGGAVQGAGYALMEKIVHEKGKITSNSFTTYIIPTSLDAPLVNAVIVEDAFPQGPYGAKGFGEQPLMGVAPAVANAIRHAAGIRLLELPATPENVLKLLEKNEELNAKKPE
jgi:CO/xanthine dehydrogenase Mo-binding subunit